MMILTKINFIGIVWKLVLSFTSVSFGVKQRLSVCVRQSEHRVRVIVLIGIGVIWADIADFDSGRCTGSTPGKITNIYICILVLAEKWFFGGIKLIGW